VRRRVGMNLREEKSGDEPVRRKAGMI